MAIVWESIGRQPRKNDFRPPFSKYSGAPYLRKFGSWREALEAFVETANEVPTDEVVIEVVAQPTPSSFSEDFSPMVEQEKPKLKRTARDPGWRLRFLVMRGDRFTCRICGRSPALHPDLVLVVDHVLAWSKGGETIFENLQTLCDECNGGKSDLGMN